MVVGFSVAGAGVGAKAAKAAGSNSLDATQLGSWLTINSDNTILMRTGKPEMGQGSASAGYAQILAEELNVPFSAITSIVMGDTDRTPDGGIAAGFLGAGATNLRLVGAYTFQALLGLASTQLGVPTANLTVQNGVVSGGGKTVTYGQLVSGQQLKLTIPVTGNLLGGGLTVGGTPPTKPVSQYTVVGTSQPMATIPPIVTGTATWVGNIVLPEMLHARMVKPSTFGSTLVSVGRTRQEGLPEHADRGQGQPDRGAGSGRVHRDPGRVDRRRKTKWSDWSDLPGSGNVTPVHAQSRLHVGGADREHEHRERRDPHSRRPRRRSRRPTRPRSTSTLRSARRSPSPTSTATGRLSSGPTARRHSHCGRCCHPCCKRIRRTSSSAGSTAQGSTDAPTQDLTEPRPTRSSSRRRSESRFACSGCDRRT